MHLHYSAAMAPGRTKAHADGAGPSDGALMRVAVGPDLPSLMALDGLCFPPDDATLEPASLGEFEQGISDGDIVVADFQGTIVGFAQWAASDGSGGFFLSSVAVHPDHRRQHLAGNLVAAALDRTVGRTPGSSCRISTVTSPDNQAMIACLTTCGFVGTSYLHDYFGPGRHRIHFDYRPVDGYTALPDVAFVPVGSTTLLSDLLQSTENQLVDVVQLPHGAHFRISTRLDLDEGTALSNEVGVGVSFSGTMLASLIFLFGFTLVDPDVSADLVAATGGAILLTTLSLLAYANASGELARVRGGAAHKFMRLGNVWSEYGAVYPILLLTPTVVTVATSGPAGAVIGVTASLIALLYQFSPISLAARFRHRQKLWTGFGLALAALPALGVLIYWRVGTSWPWTIAFTLLILSTVTLGTLQSEAASAES